MGVVGGAERYALELARAMSRRTATRLVTFGKTAETRKFDNLTVDVFAGRPTSSAPLAQLFSLDLFDSLADTDIIHCHQLLNIATSLTAAYANRAAIPVVVTDLGGGPSPGPSQPDTSGWFDAHLHISSFSLSLADPSQRARSVVISGGVDAGRFSPSNPATDFADALFVGRVLPHKGIDTLIAALPDDRSLRIVGQIYDERYYADLRSLARRKRVIFATDVDDSALVAEYRAARVLVLPSVYTTIYGASTRAPELLGQSLLEAMACGIPTICTDAGGMTEIVADGVSGLVVPPGDASRLRTALEWIWENPAEARDMGARGRERVLEMFSWDAVVDRCLTAYRSAISTAA